MVIWESLLRAPEPTDREHRPRARSLHESLTSQEPHSQDPGNV